MRLEHLGDLVADPHHRVERGHRLLEDHADLAAAHVLHRGLVEREQVAPVEPDRARRPASPPCGSRPITACAIIDLPEPDSPTTQSISPAAIAARRPRPRSARSASRRQGERRGSRSTRTGSTISVALAGEARVERVVQAFADQVERQHGQEDRDAREEADPPGVEQARAAGADHVAPAHQVRIAEPEEGQRGFEQDRRARSSARPSR